MSWKTSKAFVSSEERIAKLEKMVSIYGSQSSGANARYMTKEDYPKLAGLTEGGFAVDIFLKKDREKRRMIISSEYSKASNNSIDMSERKSGIFNEQDLIKGVLASGESEGSKKALSQMKDKDVMIFWYNGKWNIIKKTIKDKKPYIPISLANEVSSDSEMVKKISKETFKGTDYESVDARQMADLMGMGETLFSYWQFDGILNIMLNTEMQDGPYQLRRRDAEIKITLYRSFKDISNSDEDRMLLLGTPYRLGQYSTKIDEGFKKWEQPYANFGDCGGVTVAISLLGETSNKLSTEINIDNSITNKEAPNVETAGSWSIKNIGIMTMCSGRLKDYSENKVKVTEYVRDAGHEFGHLLGISEGYGNKDETPEEAMANKETPMDDIMRDGYTVTPNDIEMIFLAALKNKKQYFYSEIDADSGMAEEKSEAITWKGVE